MMIARFGIVAAVACAAAPAVAEEWHLVSEDNDNWHLVDADTKTPTQFWYGVFHTNDPKLSITKVLNSYRCATGEYRMVHFVTYDHEGTPINNQRATADWMPAAPGSHIAKALNYVCNGVDAADGTIDDLHGFWTWKQQQGN